MSKICFVCALYCEAKPIIYHFSLKPKETQSSIQVFENENIVLVITGVSKVSSAIATTYVLTHYPEISRIINIGICGAKDHKKGSVFLIHKIIDHDTGRTFYPDLCLEKKQNFSLSSLRTISRPLYQDSYDELIDMEASGFFEAASCFLSAEKIQLLKIVSDNFDQFELSPKYVELLIEKILPFLENFLAYFPQNISVSYNMKKNDAIQKFIKKYSLSFTQEHKFYDLLWSLHIQKGENVEDILKSLDIFSEAEESKKNTAKTVLSLLQKKLLT